MASPTPVKTATRIVRRDGARARAPDRAPTSAWSAPASPACRRRWRRRGSAARWRWSTGCTRSAARRSIRSSGRSAACSPTATAATSSPTASRTDILRDLGAQGALHYRHGGPSNTIVVQYDEVALARWIEEQVRAAGITVLLGAVMRERHARRPAHPGDRACDALRRRARLGDRLRRCDRRCGAGLECRACLPRGRPTGRSTAPRWWCIEDIDEAQQPERAGGRGAAASKRRRTTA